MDRIYNEYFQKSRVFLYPMLNIKKGVKYTPIETYITWENNVDITESKLICLYKIHDNKNFLKFENDFLLMHKNFDNYYQIDDNKAVYTFKVNKNDWKHFLSGRYSLLSEKLKTQIINFHKNYSNISYIKSYLYPNEYFETYSNILLVKKSVLKQVGELCDKPDLKKEQLILINDTLEIKDI